MQATLEQRLAVLEDIEAIRKLKARYCAACDDNHNAETLGTLFAEDATWEASNMGRAVGRAAIQEMLGAVGRSGRIRNSAHHAINPILDVDGDRATGHWRLIMLYTANTPDRAVQYLRIIGWYREAYVRVRGEWLFQSLACTVEEHAPYALASHASGIAG
jgi:ketosteroid isomerase-like protein